jgi:hypothetical protein
MARDRDPDLDQPRFVINRRLTTIIAAAILAAAGLAPHLSVAKDGLTTADDTMVGQRHQTAFRVQPTIESVRDGLALKGPPSPAELGLKNAIERSANELRNKIIICRGC